MKSLITILVLLLLIGCGKKQSLVFDQPSPPTGGRYETAYVNPELIVADSLITLIRSERIDSIFVPRPDMSARLAPAISFQVSEQSCPVRVELLDGRSQFVLPLLVRNLRSGYYKLTFQVDRFTASEHHSANYYLRAEFCNNTITEAFVSD
jgi:hypothetical protein